MYHLIKNSIKCNGFIIVSASESKVIFNPSISNSHEFSKMKVLWGRFNSSLS